MLVGTAMAAAQHFQTSVFPLHLGGLIVPGYAALYAVIVNLVVAALVTLGMDLLGAKRGRDDTHPGDYHLSGDAPSTVTA
jgi:SSS family solute:Na+ symporter